MNSTVTAYNKYADTYRRGVEKFWQQFPVDTPDAFCSILPGKRILNLGSGSGQDAVLLRKRGLDVLCLDGAPAMAKITEELGFTSIVSTFENMQFHEGEFDGVWAYTSLIHIPPLETAQILHKLHHFLKPSGILAVGVVVGNREGVISDNFMPGAKRYIKDYSPSELRGLVTTANFKFEVEKHYLPEDLMQVTDPDGSVRSYQEDYVTQIYSS